MESVFNFCETLALKVALYSKQRSAFLLVTHWRRFAYPSRQKLYICNNQQIDFGMLDPLMLEDFGGEEGGRNWKRTWCDCPSPPAHRLRL